MKKFLSFFVGLMISFSCFAQLPNGSIAPDFTTTDLNGNSINLYSILDSGKPVVFDISATWCGPCWSYHNTHALKTLHETYGPAGQDKLRVFFVEGDPTTNIACLTSASGCNSTTQGNWITGTPYPIVNDDNLANLYDIAGYPTVFLVCPDKTLKDIGQPTAAAAWTQASQCAIATGVNNAGIFAFKTGATANEICGDLQISPNFRLTNVGTAPMTSCVMELKYNGAVLQTKTWNGNLNTYGGETFTFDPITLNSIGTMDVAITQVNGTTDEVPANNAATATFIQAPEVNTNTITLKIKTDNYAGEFYWEFRDDAGSVLDFGGNVLVGPDGGGTGGNFPASPTAYANATTITENVAVPAVGCYNFVFVDWYGDGLCCGEGAGNIKLYNSNDLVVPVFSLTSTAANFATKAKTIGTSSSFVNVENVLSTQDFDVYPNPAATDLTIDYVVKSRTEVGVQVTNALGQLVQMIAPASHPEGFHQTKLPVHMLADGMYYVSLTTSEGMITKKFFVKK